jgi:hypothetical protein
MNGLESRYEVTRRDLAKDKLLKYGAWTSPALFSVVPALFFFILFFVFGSTPPAAVSLVFLTVISLVIGFIFGLIVAGGIMFYRSKWVAKIKERIAVDGIKAHEVEWFKNELTTTEKKSLREIETKDLLLADAFRDTLAARMTATRILKSTKTELLLVQKRQNKLKYLKSENSTSLQEELKTDASKLKKIKTEAEEMLTEAQTRVQMIEAASRRGTSLVDNELALKKLSARSAELPLALKSARMDEEIRREIEREFDQAEK